MSRFQSGSMNTRLALGLTVALVIILPLLLVRLLLPWLLGFALVWGGWLYWRRRQQFQRELYRCFYAYLQANQGRISVLGFAMAAHITGPQAREFLDARARDFFAEFEPTDQGDIFYTFRTPNQLELYYGDF